MADRLLYIMGTARSGSTMLQILLSRAEGAFGAGELSHIVEDLFLDRRTCSCGDPSCSLWEGVRRRVGWNAATAVDIRAVFRETDAHRAVWSCRGDLAVYGVCNRKILDSIRAETGARVIIDGSKYAARALALNQVLPIRVICLTRSLAGLRSAWSRQVDPVEQPPKSAAQVLAYWGYVTPSLQYAWGQIGAVLPVTYRELAEDPAETLRRIGEFAELDMAPVIAAIGRSEPFSVGHLLRGNRLRRDRQVRWQPELP